MNFFKDLMAAFSKDESGAVTVDYVILTAAVVLMAGAAATAITTGVSAKVATISI